MLWFKKRSADEIKKVIMVVGLGNPGREYHLTRHNIGFLLVDYLAKRLDIELTRVQNRAIIGKSKLEDKLIILAKPQTYMNNSGSSIMSLVKYYKINTPDLMVVHDDVDLTFGSIRIRPGGSSPGHRGVDSVIKAVGSKEFPRMRLGIGRPPGNKSTQAYVLERFLPGELDFLDGIINKGADAVQDFIKNGLESAMNRFNSRNE